MGIAGTIGLAFGVSELIETAASVNAANSQLEQTFGSLETAATEAMQRVADESGIVATRLQSVGTSIYAFAKTAGMESSQALGLMEDALQVTADQAAYYDRSLEDVSESLKSFLKGNYANDAALGLSCTETTRNAAANKMYSKSFSELSEAQKQLVLLQMVKDANDLSGATGQAAREADGWENVLGNLKETWKQLLAVVGQPVLKAATSFVKNLTAALAELTVWAQTAYNALADFFGWEQIESSSASAASDAADAISSAVEEQEALTDAASETAKAEENALAAFDNINKLSDTSSDSGTDSSSDSGGTTSSTTVPVVLDTESAVEAAEEAAKDISEILGGALVPLLDAWSDYGKPLTDSMKYAFSSIGSMLSAIGSSFAEVWKNGTGYTICSEILQILTNIFNTIGNIAQSFATAWSGGAGTAIVQGFADLFIVTLDVIERCTGATAEWAASLDFSPVLEAISGLLASILPLSQKIGDALVWVYEDVLLPLAKWVIEDAAPASINVFSGVIDVLVAVIDALQPLGEWLWNSFLAPIAKWTGGVIVTVLQALASALSKISDWIKNHEGAVRSIAAAVAILGTSFAIASVVTEAASALQAAGGVMGILSTAVSGVSTAFSMLNSPIVLVAAAIAAIIAIGALLITHWDEVKEFAAKVWEKVCDIFSSVGEFFRSVWESICQAFSNVGNWFINIFNTAVEGIEKIFSPVCNFFSNAWESIKSVFSGVGSFFSGIWNSITSAFSNVTGWFKDKFSAAWTAVKNVFSVGGKIFEGIKDGITGVFDKVVNTLIDGINTVIAVPFNAVNSAINWVRDLDIAGWQPFSSLSEISVPQIPHLAEGTVVPANYGDFLAVLGDNKREAEVVSPVSAIEQAVRNVIGSGQSDINLNVNLDGKSVYKTVIKRNNEAVRMTGKNPLATA